MISSLSYVGFGSPRAADWPEFGTEILGAQLVAGDDDVVRLRIDEDPWRIAVHAGDVDELRYIGWAVDDDAALAAAIDRLTAAGVDVQRGDEALAAERAVTAIASFDDPFGFRHELSHGRRAAPDQVELPGSTSGFVTGAGGLGHIVLIVPDLDQATAFYLDTLGFDHSDDIEMGMTVRFAHCNPRHHTLAFTSVPGLVGVHHLMLEVVDPDDVGRAYDLVNERGIPLAMTLGRHTNDEMTSFYVRTPSGFEIEYGTGGRLIDMSQPWEPGRYDAMSVWGHKPPSEPLLPGILRPVEAAS